MRIRFYIVVNEFENPYRRDTTIDRRINEKERY